MNKTNFALLASLIVVFYVTAIAAMVEALITREHIRLLGVICTTAGITFLIALNLAEHIADDKEEFNENTLHKEQPYD